MRYYPMFLNLKGRAVLLVGAGEIARQKIRALLDGEARVHVVAPEADPEVASLAREGRIRWSKRRYETADLDGVCLVIAATDDAALHPVIAREARDRGLWVNVVDVPPLCDFIAPAVVQRGDLQIAISTGGAAPALAKHLRRKLEPILGEEYVQFVDLVKRYRPQILKLPKARRLSLWECLASDAFLEQIRREGPARAEADLKEWIHAAASAA